jgi:hypothetical protein
MPDQNHSQFANYYNGPVPQDPMNQDEFLAEVQQELTVSCALPFSVPESELLRIIKYASKWFYKKYEYSVQERYYVIPKENFSKIPTFKKYGTLKLPDCIFSVIGVRQVADGFSLYNPLKSMPDFSLEKVLFKDIYTIDGSTEALMYATVYQYWIDLASHVLFHPISYNFNTNSKELVFLGEVPQNDVVLTVYEELPLGYLFKDEIFFRYVCAKAKTQLSRILGTFAFNLPGNITVNYDLLRSEGQEALEKIEEEIKTDEGMDWFFTSGNDNK